MTDPSEASAGERWRPGPRFLVRGALLAGGIGLLIGWLVDAESGWPDLESMAWSAVVGVSIFLLSTTFAAIASPLIDRLRGPLKAALLSLLFAVAGIVSWLAVWALSAVAYGRAPRISLPDLGFSLALVGTLAVAIGLAFYGYERLRLELADSVSRLKEAEFATRELALARDLQLRLLPPSEIEGPGFRTAARHRAAQGVAGDFYDVFRFADGTLGLAVADVAGKGLGASLIMASVKARLPLIAAGRSVAEALAELNRGLVAELDRREFVALCCASLDPASGEMALASAGLPEPYLIRPGAPPEPVPVSGERLPLGVRDGAGYRETRFSLAPGDRLLLFTDGLAEARTPEGDPLGYRALAELLPRAPLAPGAWLDALFESIVRRTRSDPEDDWTALLVERLPGPGGG